MTPTSDDNSSNTLLTQISAAPTQPGVYWFHSIHTPWEVMVEVALQNGQLTVFWLNREITLNELYGTWRGPVQPFGAATTK